MFILSAAMDLLLRTLDLPSVLDVIPVNEYIGCDEGHVKGLISDQGERAGMIRVTINAI